MDRGTKESLNDLLVRVREGDEGSVDELYGIMAPTVRYIALKYLRSESDADDLVQDFWLDIHKYAQTFYLNNNAYSYLCKIATRQSINRYKKLHHRRESRSATSIIPTSNAGTTTRRQSRCATT